MAKEPSREIALRYVAAVNQRLIPEDLLAPGFVIENAATAVTDATYEGADGVLTWIEDMFDILDDWRYEAEIVHVGDNYVVGKLTHTGTARESGMPLEMAYYGVMWIEDGRITRAVGYLTRAEALEAVGLSE